MKNHFIFSYAGNKRNEVENLYNHMDLEGIETIVETNCGTSAITYYISTKHPKKYKYVLNDIDSNLTKIYKTLMNVEESKKFETEVNKMVDIFNKFKTNEERKAYWDPIMRNQDNIYKYFFIRKYAGLQGRLMPLFERVAQIKKLVLTDVPIYHFLNNENIIISEKTDINVINEYKNDTTALLFIDPPYIQTTNSWYNTHDMNIYEYLYNNNINSFESKVYLILEKIWIIELLFKTNNIISSYNKTYQTGKKKTNHIIITKCELVV